MDIFEGSLEVDGVRFFFKIMGEGSPLLFLHGGPGATHEYFLPFVEELANLFKLVFFDQRGCGRSERLTDRSRYNIPEMIEDIEGLRQKLRLDRINLLGHSFGGLLALGYALKYGGNLRSLILVGSAASSAEMNEFYDEVRRQADPAAKEILQQHRASVVELLRSNKPLPAEYVRAVRSLLRGFLYAPGHEYMDSFLEQQLSAYSWDVRLEMIGGGMLSLQIEGNTKDYDLRSSLKLIRVPTLILAGAYEPPFYKLLHTEIKGSKLHIFSKSGHFPFVEEKSRFVEVVRCFIKNVEESAKKAGGASPA